MTNLQTHQDRSSLVSVLAIVLTILLCSGGISEAQTTEAVNEFKTVDELKTVEPPERAEPQQNQALNNLTLSPAELEQLLAPIALYPDTILSHILIAATYPLEVIQAERWINANPTLNGADAVNSVSDQGWDPSIQALIAFPRILTRMSEDLNWTQALGEAFLADEANVLSSVQSLRQLAQENGSLAEMDKVTVSNEGDSIIIEPIEREVIYVPYYDTRSVYGNWRWANYQPVYWDYPFHDSYYTQSYRDPFYWGPRVSVSFGFFFNTLHWRQRNIVRIPNRHYRNRQYYGHREIVGHRYVERWRHNPTHRRGVVYRNHNLRGTYRSHDDRPRQLDRRPRQEQVRTRLNNYQGDGLQRYRWQNQSNRNSVNRRSDVITERRDRSRPDRVRTRQQPLSGRDQRRINTSGNRNYQSIPDQPTRSANRPARTNSSPRPATTSRTNTYVPPPKQVQQQSTPRSGTIKRATHQRPRQVDRGLRTNPR